MVNVTTPGRSLRSASLTAGIALVLMAVLGMFANFAVIASLITPGDAARTAADIADAETLFRWGVAALVIVSILDVIVAAALFSLFEPVNRTVSATAAWFRIAYAAGFFVAIAHLASVPERLDDPEAVLAATDAFTTTWSIGLICFSAHLVVLGWLCHRSGYVPKVIGVLVVIAGLGYAFDGFGAVLVPGYDFEMALYTFLGEIVIIFWLLIKGTRTTLDRP
ncbi:DUF4386 domain-containing protein [Glycomyces halotolerans]